MKRAEILFLMMAAMSPAIFRPVLADQNCVCASSSRHGRMHGFLHSLSVPWLLQEKMWLWRGTSQQGSSAAARSTPLQGSAPPPGGPPTAFVAPPPTGTVEGPSTGWDLGGVSLTFPELTLKLPRLRFQGASRLRQHSRMHLDSAIAPMAQQTGMGMGMPGGMPAMAVPFTGFPNVNKDAPPPPDDKDAPRPNRPTTHPARLASLPAANVPVPMRRRSGRVPPPRRREHRRIGGGPASSSRRDRIDHAADPAVARPAIGHGAGQPRGRSHPHASIRRGLRRTTATISSRSGARRGRRAASSVLSSPRRAAPTGRGRTSVATLATGTPVGIFSGQAIRMSCHQFSES